MMATHSTKDGAESEAWLNRNGVGDLVASVVVGALWTAVSPVSAFAYAAILMGLGAMVIYRVN